MPALDVDAFSARDDAALLRGVPRVKVAVTWVPWTHRRLGRGTGYGAGVDSPGWYAHVFAHPGPEGVSRFFVDAAHVLRARGLPASPDHLIAASRLATSLAGLRRRPRPGLAEALDAADAVLGGLPLVVDELVVGEAIGEVPPEAPQVPLARDLAAAQRAGPAATGGVAAHASSSTCARRTAVAARCCCTGSSRSACRGVWSRRAGARRARSARRGAWRGSPELSVRLVERSGLGTTVVAAATSALVERAVRGVPAGRRRRHRRAGPARRPARRARRGASDRLGELAATAPDVAELMDALGPLAAARRYGDVRGTDAAALAVVFDELVVRVVAGLQRAAEGLDDDAARAMIERMSAVQAALALVDHPARTAELPAVLEPSPPDAGCTASCRAGPRGCSTTAGRGRRRGSRPGSAGR